MVPMEITNATYTLAFSDISKLFSSVFRGDLSAPEQLGFHAGFAHGYARTPLKGSFISSDLSHSGDALLVTINANRCSKQNIGAPHDRRPPNDCQGTTRI